MNERLFLSFILRSIITKNMKLFKVSLTKTYLVEINAENENEAKRFAEFFTSNIEDISNKGMQNEYNFSIKNIECTLNESFEAEEL